MEQNILSQRPSYYTQCFLSPPIYGGMGYIFFGHTPLADKWGGDFPPHLTQNFNESGGQEVDYFPQILQIICLYFPKFSRSRPIGRERSHRVANDEKTHEVLLAQTSYFGVLEKISSGVFCRKVGGDIPPKRPTPIENTVSGKRSFCTGMTPPCSVLHILCASYHKRGA